MRGQDGIGWGELREKTLADASLTDADARLIGTPLPGHTSPKPYLT